KPKRRSFALSTCKNEQAAQERMELLAGLVRRLRDAGREDLVEELVDRAASAEGRALGEMLRTADLIAAGKLAGIPKEADPIPTIRQLGTLWTSGELHKQFPDHIKKKTTADDDAGRLEKHVYPVIGEIPIDAFTLDHANLVMAGIRAGRAPATRRHVAQLLHRICAMALFPLRVIKTNPLPEGFLPPIPTGKAKSWLYPDEDTKLLSAKPVPLAWRVFYGFLHREGLRFSEAVRLTWTDVDLERGVLVLDKNKTEEPRAWALSLGVVAGLRAWRALRERDGVLIGPKDPVFINEHGKPIQENHAARRYREHLMLARITRGILYERTTMRQPIRAHDTRATFVTISLANGKSEAWVMDRTGHKSSLMINKYRRAARTAAELHLGDLKPLNEAIPELVAVVVATIDVASPIPILDDSSSLPASPTSDSSLPVPADGQPQATAGNESPRETPEKFVREQQADSSGITQRAVSLLVAPAGLEPARLLQQGILKAIMECRIVANRVNEGVLETVRDGSHGLLTIQTHLLTIP
ncbi:MAG TPA: tyrosine-type recombinase/integrase, partial [Polyangium sp.]|nr:tyrosine-type recombinase/integrase [Polyangium sp.]